MKENLRKQGLGRGCQNPHRGEERRLWGWTNLSLNPVSDIELCDLGQVAEPL